MGQKTFFICGLTELLYFHFPNSSIDSHEFCDMNDTSVTCTVQFRCKYRLIFTANKFVFICITIHP